MFALAELPAHVGLTPDDLARRRHTLGSSEIAAVLGINPWQSLHQVWLAKVHGVEFEGNEATQLGQLLEPSILAVYAHRYGKHLVKGEYTVGPEPWMACTPDALIVGGGICEAKLGGFHTFWMWGPGNTDVKESDAMPMHYLVQALWQLIVTGEPFVDVGALLGSELRSYRVHRNEALERQLVERGRDFWHRYVVPQLPPPVDGSEGAKEMLKTLYPRSGAEPIEATPAIEEIAESLLMAREALRQATGAKQLAENKLKAEIREARGAFGNGWRVRYAHTKTGSRPFVFDHQKEKGNAA